MDVFGDGRFLIVSESDPVPRRYTSEILYLYSEERPSSKLTAFTVQGSVKARKLFYDRLQVAKPFIGTNRSYHSKWNINDKHILLLTLMFDGVADELAE